MAEQNYAVHCTWDDEARVGVATSDDVPGLATGADTLDDLIDKLKVVIPELLEANGVLSDADGGISFSVHAERHSTWLARVLGPARPEEAKRRA